MTGYRVNLTIIYLFILSVLIACLQMKLTCLVSFLLSLFICLFLSFFFCTLFSPIYLFFVFTPSLFYIIFRSFAFLLSLLFLFFFFYILLHGYRQKDEWNVAIHALSTSKFALRKPGSNSKPEIRCFFLV